MMVADEAGRPVAIAALVQRVAEPSREVERYRVRNHRVRVHGAQDAQNLFLDLRIGQRFDAFRIVSL